MCLADANRLKHILWSRYYTFSLGGNDIKLFFTPCPVGTELECSKDRSRPPHLHLQAAPLWAYFCRDLGPGVGEQLVLAPVRHLPSLRLRLRNGWGHFFFKYVNTNCDILPRGVQMWKKNSLRTADTWRLWNTSQHSMASDRRSSFR